MTLIGVQRTKLVSNIGCQSKFSLKELCLGRGGGRKFEVYFIYRCGLDSVRQSPAGWVAVACGICWAVRVKSALSQSCAEYPACEEELNCQTQADVTQHSRALSGAPEDFAGDVLLEENLALESQYRREKSQHISVSNTCLTPTMISVTYSILGEAMKMKHQS